MPNPRDVKSIGGLLHPGADSDYGRRGRSDWLDFPWDRHLHRVRIDGREARYVDAGTGPALVFIHGLGASWQSWLENIPEFSHDHRVIAMDLPGFGCSETAEEVSIEYYADWTFRLLDALGIEAGAIVGNSMGGFIAADMAIRRPERVQRLALVSAAVFWQEYRRAQPLVELARRSDAIVARWLTQITDAVATRPRLRSWALATGGFRYPHLIEKQLAHETVRSARRTGGYLPALEAMADFPLEEELPKISCPALIVWGAQDTLVPVKDAKRLEDLIPDSRRVVFERTGHVAMLERPERFNALLREFLDEPEQGEGEGAAAERAASG